MIGTFALASLLYIAATKVVPMISIWEYRGTEKVPGTVSAAEKVPGTFSSIPLYAITVAAGIVGILVGIAVAGGTAALYPIPTGGKPIVARPVVAIIAYETMMLVAIVTTFVVALIRVRSAAALAMLLMCVVIVGCSPDMQDQPSYQPQEAPRLHSPDGSVPRDSRRIEHPSAPSDPLAPGRRLFAINCAHCHGADGTGTGPVSAYLKEQPKDLRSQDMRTVSETGLFEVITVGGDVMPSFDKLLTPEERRAVARYVKSLPSPQPSPPGRGQGEGAS
jgi:mono/diheme cytochrome c family protein